MIMDL